MNEASLIASFLEKNRRIAFGNSPLIPHRIRTYKPSCWVRLYSLPEAKRYPETAADWDQLLSRQNDIFEYLTTADNQLYFIETKIVSAARTENMPRIGCLSEFVFDALEPVDVSFEDPHLFDAGDSLLNRITSIRWKRHRIDDVLRAFANDTLRGFFLTADGQTWIIPYDGGVDLVFNEEKARNACADYFKRWRSDRADGL
ncbi:MAG: hypothetical protein ACKO5C_08060 [Ferruginibacter sp.]